MDSKKSKKKCFARVITGLKDALYYVPTALERAKLTRIQGEVRDAIAAMDDEIYGMQLTLDRFHSRIPDSVDMVMRKYIDTHNRTSSAHCGVSNAIVGIIEKQNGQIRNFERCLYSKNWFGAQYAVS